MDAETTKRTVTVPQVLEMLGLDPPERVPGLMFCPLHDNTRTPAFSVSSELWYCHTCGIGGSVIDLLMQVGGCTFRQALRYLDQLDDGAVDLPQTEAPPERELPDLTSTYERVKPAREYEMAGFEKWYLDKFVGSVLPYPDAWKVGDGNLWIPHRDAGGVVRGIKLRKMIGQDVGAKHSVTGSVFTTRLYRVSEPSCRPAAILVEGETDTWTMDALTPSTAVYGLPAGVNCIKPQFISELAEHKRVWICLDADQAADKAREKLLAVLPQARLMRLPDGYKDATEAVKAGWRPRV